MLLWNYCHLVQTMFIFPSQSCFSFYCLLSSFMFCLQSLLNNDLTQNFQYWHWWLQGAKNGITKQIQEHCPFIWRLSKIDCLNESIHSVFFLDTLSLLQFFIWFNLYKIEGLVVIKSKEHISIEVGERWIIKLLDEV